MLETLQQFIIFSDESYSASPHDLALFVMTCNCNSQTTQYLKNKIKKDNLKKIKKNTIQEKTLQQWIVIFKKSYSAFFTYCNCNF